MRIRGCVISGNSTEPKTFDDLKTPSAFRWIEEADRNDPANLCVKNGPDTYFYVTKPADGLMPVVRFAHNNELIVADLPSLIRNKGGKRGRVEEYDVEINLLNPRRTQ